MRKRAQRKSKTTEPQIEKNVSSQPKTLQKKICINKNWWITFSLIGIFLLVLFLNSYFNVYSDIAVNPEMEGFDKFYLSGPDPYYNMRLVEETYETGSYPFFSNDDPLLDYPFSRSGGRPPLFNMMALGFSRLLTPFMGEIDAIGYSMQFIPALFGALLIFPVYFIGKMVFNKKAGLIGALFVALIPAHISSGHGSAYSLFDHDSFNLFLFFATFMCLVKSIREKDLTKSVLWAMLGGIPLAGLTMTWVEAEYLYVVIAFYAFVQIFIDAFRGKAGLRSFISPLIILITGYVVSLPVFLGKWGGFQPNLLFLLCIGVAAFGVLYLFLSRRKIPWTISMPALICVTAFVLVLLFYIETVSSYVPAVQGLSKISEVIFGSGIYGHKVSLTIAEAHTYQISNSVMSFGPGLYWLGWAGFIAILYMFYKHNGRKDYLFLIVLFGINVWLTSTAGRFINDMVPVIAMLGGWITWIVIYKIDYKQMIRNIKSAGGGFHGLRRGVKFLHLVGILCIAFLVVLPNAFIVIDAAVPNARTQNYSSLLKKDMFGEDHSAAYGLSIGKEKYWGDAFYWLSQQDTDIEDPADRPAFISWWDYGFYEAAMGDHPTVADNFQDGIPPAGNFHTATSEESAVAVWIIRLLDGDSYRNKGRLSLEIKEILGKYLNQSDVENISFWLENPKQSPSYGSPIYPEYYKYIRDEVERRHLTVGAQWPENAFYHDISALLLNETKGLSDENLTSLYHDIQEATGWSIRYYGVEGYDKQIFNIFAFLSDKSLLMAGAPSDMFIQYTFDGQKIDPVSGETIQTYSDEPLKTYLDMPDSEKRLIQIEDQAQNFLDPYFNTMFFNTYFGKKFTSEEVQGNTNYRFKLQVPCVNMKHFYAEYISDLSKPGSQYYSGIAAVVIAKYYEGAKIRGNVTFLGEPLDDIDVAVVKNLTYHPELTAAIDHDKDVTENGSFNVLAGAGATLQIRRYAELHSTIPWASNVFVLKNISLNISDDDAMRRTDNWDRDIGNISIEPAILQGVVFDDLDKDHSYNSSLDDPVSDVTVTAKEITKIIRPQQQGQSMSFEYGDVKGNSTSINGSFLISDLLPGIYELYSKYNGYFINATSLHLKSGKKTLNITKPSNGGIEGVVYYDSNFNGIYDDDDEVLDDTNVELIHLKSPQPTPSQYVIPETVAEMVTNEKGEYSFESLIPGSINGAKVNTYQLKVSNDKYNTTQSVYPEENKTLSFNLSVDLTSVNVTGKVKDKGTSEIVENIEIEFTPDLTVENNTAESSSTKSDGKGNYQVDLIPGAYNITVEDREGSTLVYSYLGKLELSIGEGSRSGVNIDLTKHSVTTSGETRYNGNVVDNVTILFEKDSSIENNIALSRSIESDATGFYSVELSPGSYKVSVNETKNENGQNYTYAWEGSLVLTESDINTGKEFDIDQIERFLKEE